MVCKHCGSTNVVKGVRFGNTNTLQSPGPIYKESLLIVYPVRTLCDLCDDCGEIQRLYIRPTKGGTWVTSDYDYEELVKKREKERISDSNEKLITEQIREYSKKLIAKQVVRKYVDSLDLYEKHEWYDYPVKTKGPSYRLYVEKVTGYTVLVKPTTMNKHKGNYVVCYLKNDKMDDEYKY